MKFPGFLENIVVDMQCAEEMESWNVGIVDIKTEKNRSIVFHRLNPSFQYSIIPMFQLGQSSRVVPQ